VLGAAPARLLCGFLPDGNELSFEEFAGFGSDGPTEEAIREIADRYGSRFVDPPL
jgi:hypothetical protein